ncbi:uncharacterized protein BYT42DRAFT_400766 [Radiomyces spectabilis]|uniref:uncharacterized protein n=1 Tax=Radiomyces spectabilis TaxID=64574 RepID=UPI00221FD6B1|nr:uncharacterized protein BYT42DRAFT_400766 [Radiomyces spectabilis]KAI8374346.1 hypothetical protein BYT42DRAFT_400766 [Radiomyces spectabilis]
MDCLFRGTKVKCVDRELASEATKAVKMYKEAILNITSADTRGKKIDLLIKYGSTQGVEISSNEFKSPQPTPIAALQQQCKNLRTNAAILNIIRSLDPRKSSTHVAAVDWLGSVGYLYLMADIDGLYYAQKVGILSLPRSLHDVPDFRSTLDSTLLPVRNFEFWIESYRCLGQTTRFRPAL